MDYGREMVTQLSAEKVDTLLAGHIASRLLSAPTGICRKPAYDR